MASEVLGSLSQYLKGVSECLCLEGGQRKVPVQGSNVSWVMVIGTLIHLGGQTDMYEKITFSQLRWQEVNMNCDVLIYLLVPFMTFNYLYILQQEKLNWVQNICFLFKYLVNALGPIY